MDAKTIVKLSKAGMLTMMYSCAVRFPINFPRASPQLSGERGARQSIGAGNEVAFFQAKYLPCALPTGKDEG